MAATQRHSYYVPLLAAVGADYMVTSDEPQFARGWLIPAPGATSASIVFDTPLADANYAVIAQGEGRNDLHVDESTKTVNGFDIITSGAAIAVPVNIMLLGGRLPNQPVKPTP